MFTKNFYKTKKRGEEYVSEKLNNFDEEKLINAIAGDKSGDELDALLKSNGLLFLKPVGNNLSKNVTSRLEKGDSPDSVLKYIASQVNPEVPVDFLLATITKTCMDKAVTAADSNAADIFNSFAPLIQRAVFKAPKSEKQVVFALQSAWFAAGADKKVIKGLAQALFESQAISYDGFDQWREDTTNKSKGKLPMLIKITSFLEENRPKEPDYEEDEEEGEDEEEIDDYLTNPNAEYFS
jgi:hypothetical protein